MRLLVETQETRQYFRQPVEEQGWLWFLPQLRSPNKINIEPYKINIESASCNISHISLKMKTSTPFKSSKCGNLGSGFSSGLSFSSQASLQLHRNRAVFDLLWSKQDYQGNFYVIIKDILDLWSLICQSKITKWILTANHLDPLNDHPPASSYLFKFVLVRNTQFRMLDMIDDVGYLGLEIQYKMISAILANFVFPPW